MRKYVFTRVVTKIKIFHSCRTRVVRVALVSQSCPTWSTRVALVLLVSDTHLVKLTRLKYCLKAWNDFSEKSYKKRDFYSFIKDCLVVTQKDIVTEGKMSDFSKLVYSEPCVIYKCENIKLLVFLVLLEPFSVKKKCFWNNFWIKLLSIKYSIP